MNMTIKPSIRHAIFLLFSHLLAAFLLALTEIQIEFRLAGAVLIIVSFSFYFSRDVFRILPDSWMQISLGSDGLSVFTRDGAVIRGKIERGTVVITHLIILRITTDGRFLPFSRVIFPDALSVDGFRNLCVRLKYY